tara:strand:+ start:316 stop:546 length:231 start_codon:yes stop_codon:yes gene_type:complete
MRIKVYGADWCSDCIKVKNFLESRSVEFEYIIVENDRIIAFIERVNNGKRVIPTLDINGKIYSNPGINELTKIITQ